MSNIKKNTDLNTTTTVGRGALWSSSRFSVRQYGFVLIGLLLLAGGIVLFAASPASFARLNADQGSLAGGATIQSNGAASDGKFVQFGSAQTGSGGGGANMIVGLNEAGWGPNGPKDVAGAVKYGRLDTASGESANDFADAGVKVDLLIAGPYNGGGVSAINAASWASNALSTYKSSGCNPTECPMLEVLNEPGGSWFWGSNAKSTTNAAAYASLLKAVHDTFTTAYGSSHPLILASYDGGSRGDNTWGHEVWSANSSVGNYVDGVTEHPYGGHGSDSAQGARAAVTDANTSTHKPVYITELGWPTAVGQPATGDSLQWTPAQQCNNIYNFIVWARGTGYVNAVIIFGYRDYGTNAFYGVETSGGTKKPSYSGLHAAANSLPTTCPPQ